MIYKTNFKEEEDRRWLFEEVKTGMWASNGHILAPCNVIQFPAHFTAQNRMQWENGTWTPLAKGFHLTSAIPKKPYGGEIHATRFTLRDHTGGKHDVDLYVATDYVTGVAARYVPFLSMGRAMQKDAESSIVVLPADTTDDTVLAVVMPCMVELPDRVYAALLPVKGE